MKIVSIVGARPQFIKLAPLSKEIRKYHKEIIIHTGQHFDKEMSDLFFRELEIAEPDYNLNINSGLHGEQTGRMLIELEKVLIKEKPDLIIVFGDTNSTLAGALCGAKLHIPIAHVEAGLRSFNKKMPEEINRIATDHISDYLFAPTKTAMENLGKENLNEKSYLTGDIMVDSLKYALEKSKNSKVLEQLNIKQNEYYLATLHRPYNVDDPKILAHIISEFGKLSKKVILPIHPRTNKIISQEQIKINSNITITKPFGYLDFVNLLANALKIITDSGGIQKEAYILKRPCITLRSETEWVETLEVGWNILINPKGLGNIVSTIENFHPAVNYLEIFGSEVKIKIIDIILY